MDRECCQKFHLRLDKPEKPTDAELTAALGPAKPLWD